MKSLHHPALHFDTLQCTGIISFSSIALISALVFIHFVTILFTSYPVPIPDINFVPVLVIVPVKARNHGVYPLRSFYYQVPKWMSSSVLFLVRSLSTSVLSTDLDIHFGPLSLRSL